MSPTPAPPITLKDKAGKAYTVIAVSDETVTPPEGFGEAEALLIAGQPVPNWVSSDGKTVLIRAKDSGGKVGFFSYDAVLKLIKSYSAPVRFSVSGRDLLIVMDPDLAGEIPKGFTETTAKVGGQDVLAWKYETAEPGTGLFGVYLLCLEDSTGRTAFYLFDEKTSDIMSFDTLQDHGLLVTSATTATLPSVTPQATPTPTPPPAAETPAVSPVLLVVVVVLAAICVSETAYIVWSLIERRKGKPRIRRV